MQITHLGIANGKGGRFGNQLFLIASTIGIAINNDLKYGFPEWKNNTYFKEKLPGLAPGPGNIIKEQSFDYNPVIIPKNSFTYLEGYFQSEKYFNTSAAINIIRNAFTFKDEYIQPVKDSLKGITNTCSIHVRRGDYLNYPDIHIQQPVEYWHSAQTNIENSTNVSTYIVMSDDINWCKENKHLFTTTGKKVLFMQGRNDIDDFIMMTLCEHNIITNSTFSWWAAWLNVNKDKVVVAPKQWFGTNSPSDGKDLYVEGWIKV
jgi:hypothetical protein